MASLIHFKLTWFSSFVWWVFRLWLGVWERFRIVFVPCIWTVGRSSRRKYDWYYMSFEIEKWFHLYSWNRQKAVCNNVCAAFDMDCTVKNSSLLQEAHLSRWKELKTSSNNSQARANVMSGPWCRLLSVLRTFKPSAIIHYVIRKHLSIIIALYVDGHYGTLPSPMRHKKVL